MFRFFPFEQLTLQHHFIRPQPIHAPLPVDAGFIKAGKSFLQEFPDLAFNGEGSCDHCFWLSKLYTN